MIRGRQFAASDREGMPPVAIVNQAMARRFWNGDAVGRTLRIEGEATLVQVIGIAGDLRHRSSSEGP